MVIIDCDPNLAHYAFAAPIEVVSREQITHFH